VSWFNVTVTLLTTPVMPDTLMVEG